MRVSRFGEALTIFRSRNNDPNFGEALTIFHSRNNDSDNFPVNRISIVQFWVYFDAADVPLPYRA